MENEVDVGMGPATMIPTYLHQIKLTDIFYFDELVWWTRIPIPIQSLNTFTAAFSLPVWLFIFLTLFVFSLIFKLTNWIYLHETNLSHLTSKDEWSLNFLLLTFFAFSESDSLPWFRKNSAGN